MAAASAARRRRHLASTPSTRSRTRSVPSNGSTWMSLARRRTASASSAFTYRTTGASSSSLGCAIGVALAGQRRAEPGQRVGEIGCVAVQAVDRVAYGRRGGDGSSRRGPSGTSSGDGRLIGWVGHGDREQRPVQRDWHQMMATGEPMRYGGDGVGRHGGGAGVDDREVDSSARMPRGGPRPLRRRSRPRTAEKVAESRCHPAALWGRGSRHNARAGLR